MSHAVKGWYACRHKVDDCRDGSLAIEHRCAFILKNSLRVSLHSRRSAPRVYILADHPTKTISQRVALSLLHVLARSALISFESEEAGMFGALVVEAPRSETRGA